MKLEDIKEVFQTTEYKEVNKSLDKGYKIIKIFNGRLKENNVEFQHPVYVLGR